MIRKSLIVLSAFLMAACAANRGPEELRFDQTKDWIEKSSLTGSGLERSLYLFKNTIVRTSSNGGFGFMGLQSDVKLGYFEFTENNLQFKTMEGIYEGRESANVVNRVVVQWPATHHDVRLDVNEGRVTNRQIDDNFKRWDQKKYINVDLNQPSIGEEQTLPYSTAVATTLQCWTLASRERVRDSMQQEADGYFSFMVEAVYKQNPLCAQRLSQFHDSDFTYTVHYRYSFRKYDPSPDYVTFEYQRGEKDPARYKYGYFQTVRPVADATIPGGRRNRFFANRWNPNKVHSFYFADGTPEKYKPIFRDIFDQTNKIFAKTGNAIRFNVYDHNYNHETGENDGKPRQFGDLRYSFINIVDELDPSSPLGYGPSDADPLTGEILAANTMIWTGSLEYYMVRLKLIAETDEISDGVSKFETESLYQKMTQALEIEPGDWTTQWDMKNSKIGQAYQKLVADTTFNVGGNPYTYHTGEVDVPAIMLRPAKRGANEDTATELIASLTDVIDLPMVVNQSMVDRKRQSLLNGHVNKSFIHSDVFSTDKTLKRMAEYMAKRGGSADLSHLSHGMQSNVEHRFLDAALNEKGHCIYPMEAAVAGGPEVFLDGRTKEDLIETIVYRVGIHEVGHNLNLRHNFYGTVDNANFRLHEDPETRQYLEEVSASVDRSKHHPKNFIDVDGKTYWAQVSSSVMDYLRLEHEDHSPRTWEDYDRAAIFYAYSGGQEIEPGRDYLFCTDEHATISALCNRFDVGSTPSEILLSIIEGYENSYALVNYRNDRPFWDTSRYGSRVFGTMWSVKEFYPLWRAAFAQDQVNNSLASLGINDNREQDEIYETINREMKKTNMLAMAFYQSVIQQSAVDKPFRPVIDERTGSLERLGIGIDKQIAMYFLAGDDSFPYHPNRYTIHQSYLSHMFDSGMAKFSHKIWENVVTQRVDMEQGFISYGRWLYSRAAKNFYNRDSQDFIRRIQPARYDNLTDLQDELGVELDSEFNARSLRVKNRNNSEFKYDEEVVVINYNGDFYVVSKTASPYAYTVARSVIFNLNNGFSSVQDKIDLEELFEISH